MSSRSIDTFSHTPGRGMLWTMYHRFFAMLCFVLGVDRRNRLISTPSRRVGCACEAPRGPSSSFQGLGLADLVPTWYSAAIRLDNLISRWRYRQHRLVGTKRKALAGCHRRAEIGRIQSRELHMPCKHARRHRLRSRLGDHKSLSMLSSVRHCYSQELETCITTRDDCSANEML